MFAAFVWSIIIALCIQIPCEAHYYNATRKTYNDKKFWLQYIYWLYIHDDHDKITMQVRNELLEEFATVSYYKHIWYRLTFRNPLNLYPMLKRLG